MERLFEIDKITKRDIASICDHTFLNRSEAYRAPGVNAIFKRADAFASFLEGTINSDVMPYAVCVRPEDVTRTTRYFEEKNSPNIVIASVVGFPDGCIYNTDFKVAETRLAAACGAKEIDMVLNYNDLKSKKYGNVLSDISSVVRTAHEYGALVKVILETSELSDDDVAIACAVAKDAKANFVKTSTGFSSAGATPNHLRIMRIHFDGGIKMSGGVNSENIKDLLYAVSGRNDGYIELNPLIVRIGEGSLLSSL